MNTSDDIKNDFSKGSVRKHIVRLAVPMTVAMLVQMLYNLVDRIYIGHLPTDSANAFTGLGLAYELAMPVTAVLVAVVVYVLCRFGVFRQSAGAGEAAGRAASAAGSVHAEGRREG